MKLVTRQTILVIVATTLALGVGGTFLVKQVRFIGQANDNRLQLVIENDQIITNEDNEPPLPSDDNQTSPTETTNEDGEPNDLSTVIRDPFSLPLAVIEEQQLRKAREERLAQILVELQEERKKEIEEQLRQEELQREKEALEEQLRSMPTTPDTPLLSETVAIETLLPLIQSFITDDLPISVVLAVLEHESNFNRYAVNLNSDQTVDRGLMQLNSNTSPSLAKQLGLSYEEGMEYDVATNVRMGVTYLLQKQNENDDLDYILTAYNRGSGGANMWFKDNQTYETTYSKKVKPLIEKYKIYDIENEG